MTARIERAECPLPLRRWDEITRHARHGWIVVQDWSRGGEEDASRWRFGDG
jgi:hypothetical protein